MSTLRIFCTPKILDDNHIFCEGYGYRCPVQSDEHEDWINLVATFPLTDPPNIFGMHSNANIVFQMQESSNLVDTCRDINPQDSSGEGQVSPDVLVTQLADKFEERMMTHIKRDEVGPNLSLMIGDQPDSMTSFLFQEVERFNNLIKVMTKSLDEIKKAIKGLVLMSPALNLL